MVHGSSPPRYCTGCWGFGTIDSRCMMSTSPPRFPKGELMGRRPRTLLLLAATLALGVAFLPPEVRGRIMRSLESLGSYRNEADVPPIGPPSEAGRPTAELVTGREDVLKVPPDVVECKIRTAEARTADQVRSLSLSGSLCDANRLAGVHPRFDGEVVELGTTRRPRSRLPGRVRRDPSGRSGSATRSRRASSWPSSGAATWARRRASTSTPCPGSGSSRRRWSGWRACSRTGDPRAERPRGQAGRRGRPRSPWSGSSARCGRGG